MPEIAVRYALLVPGLRHGGGVPRVAEFFIECASELDFEIEIFDLAVAHNDSASRSLSRPKSWFSKPRIEAMVGKHRSWKVGCNASEIEFMRYMPQRELTQQLNGFDLVQIVAGTPAWANIVHSVKSPVVLQVATTASQERESKIRNAKFHSRAYRNAAAQVTQFLDRRGIVLPDHVLVENSQMSNWVCQFRNAKSVTKILPGVDTQLFSPNTIWQRSGHLISVGRLEEPRKGWDRLIRAYGNLVRGDSSIPDLLLVGAGQVDSGVQRLISSEEVRNRVHILRDVSDESLACLLRQASIFVTLSHEEGLGLATMEAMSSGLPVISTRTAGAIELIGDGGAGVLIDHESAEVDFGPAVVKVLNEEGFAMSKSARQQALTRFAPEVSASQIADLYFQLVSN